MLHDHDLDIHNRKNAKKYTVRLCTGKENVLVRHPVSYL